MDTERVCLCKDGPRSVASRVQIKDSGLVDSKTLQEIGDELVKLQVFRDFSAFLAINHWINQPLKPLFFENLSSFNRVASLYFLI